MNRRTEVPPSGVVAYFGYGSLVSRLTHRTDIVNAVPARLEGWRRCWRPRPDMPGFPAALLTVRREPGAGCDGLLVFDHARNLPAIDAREARYRRLPVDVAMISTYAPPPHRCPIWLYVADEDVPLHPEPPRILQSYLDAVMLGFLTEHGEAGLRRFLDETDGFETAIHRDRDNPLYPRATALEPGMAGRFDALLKAMRKSRVAPLAIAD